MNIKIQLLLFLFKISIISLFSGCFNDFNQETPDIFKGLTAHYTFDEHTGLIAKDSSAYTINATIYGARWTEGKINGALDFDGLNNYVQIPDNQSPLPLIIKN